MSAPTRTDDAAAAQAPATRTDDAAAAQAPATRTDEAAAAPVPATRPDGAEPAPARDFADREDERGRLYEALALLLRYRPTDAVFARVRDLVGGIGGGPAAEDLRTAASGAGLARVRREFAQLFDGPRPGVGTVCAAASSAARVVALGVANVAGADHGAELQALSTLARRIARAVHNADEIDAARLAGYRARLLRDHALHCLGAFADDLARQQRCHFYARVGRALRRLLDDDGRGGEIGEPRVVNAP